MQEEKIIKINIEEEMKSAYIDYSMSVIVSRALPDVRDGLKPVHRRVLFGMSELGIASNKPYKKSARIVGEVLGKFHPHGDSSVYDAMVRMAQPWSMRYTLVDGQGNFGSVDGDSPAAMRYTEARMTKIAEEMMADLDKNTVDFQLNFDDSLEEPTVMPCAFPNLLVNGASGIAVGMATNMAPHNLKEVIDAVVAYIDNNDISIEELMHHVKGPDFPTGAIIYGYQGVKEAYETGRGRIVVRAKTDVEVTASGRDKIIVTEIPYQVNKAELIKKTADLINEKKIEGISYINDESDRNGMRIVIILKKEAKANVVLNNLFKYTQLQSTFNVNNIALVKGRPKTLNLKQLIHYYVEHRHEVVVRRTQYDLDQAEKRKHILEGLIIAVDNIDEVVSIIRGAANTEEAQNKLIERFNLSEIQARAILDMRLRALTGLSRDELHKEYEELLKLIDHLTQILADEVLRMTIIKDELLALKEKYGDERRTEIIPTAEEFNPEDFYANDDMIITISNLGYIKRTPLTEFKTQSRGGVGTKGSSTRDEDFLAHMLSATMHNTMLFFTEKGKCFWQKVYEIPEGTKASKGRAIQNLINIDQDDTVKAYINVQSLINSEYIDNHFIVLCTRNGVMKKMALEDFTRPRQNGIVAITIREGDSLMDAKLTDGNSEILVAIRSGRAIRFPETKVRAMGRTAAGVRAITLSEEEADQVVGIVCVENNEQDILVVSETGFGKRSKIDDYRITNRGGKGVKTINITDKTGKLIAVKGVTDNDDLMIINKSGITIRLAVSNLRTTGRTAQGVKLINLRKNDLIASVAQVPKSEDENYEIPTGEGGEDSISNVSNE
ncbi:MAG: DNA gyrase subunit A [Bacteroidota bacterium]|nr:DNA gyrase subunit A [Bacteroidota bacterium]